jgi:hypothetical protein
VGLAFEDMFHDICLRVAPIYSMKYTPTCVLKIEGEKILLGLAGQQGWNGFTPMSLANFITCTVAYNFFTAIRHSSIKCER